MEMETKTPRRGSFCTSVLRTRDLDRAASFYESLMGWTTQGVKGAPDHRLIQFNGRTVANLQKVESEIDVWVPSVSVENIERTTDDAVKLGATLIDRIDVAGVARLASFRDQEDTVFGLWETSGNDGAEFVQELGGIWWIEVLTNNLSLARDFYSKLFGWDHSQLAIEPFEKVYTVLKRGNDQEAGILIIEPDWGISPRWNTIFEVNDCDATVHHAIAMGSSRDYIHTVPGSGRIGVFTDPGGAWFVARSPIPKR